MEGGERICVGLPGPPPACPPARTWPARLGVDRQAQARRPGKAQTHQSTRVIRTVTSNGVGYYTGREEAPSGDTIRGDTVQKKSRLWEMVSSCAEQSLQRRSCLRRASPAKTTSPASRPLCYVPVEIFSTTTPHQQSLGVRMLKLEVSVAASRYGRLSLLFNRTAIPPEIQSVFRSPRKAQAVDDVCSLDADLSSLSLCTCSDQSTSSKDVVASS